MDQTQQKKKGIPELLAPAGGPQQLIAAIENGADAVYLGGKLFNARQNAENFDADELEKALEYTHIRGANLYITLNTLISDTEIQEALEYANAVYEAGVDALIIQDIGLLSLIKKQLPDLPLHLSTQGTVYNSEGVKAAERLGAGRVILARELSLIEIEKIVKESNIEIEVFAHGALCQSYSGQCYMSSMIGGRSGNRGTCAQPCRLPYNITSGTGDIHKVISDKGYFLSPKDFCTIEHLDKLIAAGVKSLKIEGRMKSPEYVAIVTGIYRKYLNLYAEKHKQEPVSPQDLKNLAQIYNRGGFSTGYHFSNPGRDLITRERAKHWGTKLGIVTGRDEYKRSVDILLEEALAMGDGIEIVNEDLPGNIVTMMRKNGQKTDCGEKGDVLTIGYIDGSVKSGDPVYKISEKALNKSAQETFAGKYLAKAAVTGHFKAVSQEPISFCVRDEEGHEVTINGEFIPEPAITRPLTREAAEAQLGKMGSTPFMMTDCTFDIGQDLSVPLSEINLIRRKALDELTEIRKDRYPGRKAPAVRIDENNSKTIASANLSLYLYRWMPLSALENSRADRIYLPILSLFEKEHLEIVKQLKEKGMQVFAAVPPITRGEEDNYLKVRAGDLRETGIDGVLIGNIGHLELLADCGLPLVGDYSLNIYNSQSVKTAAHIGLKGVTLSHELTLSEIKNISNGGIALEATVYGRIPVMISEHCPIGSEVSNKSDGVKCGLCKKERYFLKDRMDAEFPVTGDAESCRSTVLHCEKLYVPEYAQELAASGVDVLRLYIDDEDPKEIREITALFIAALNGQKNDPMRQKGYTKGYYRRGSSK